MEILKLRFTRPTPDQAGLYSNLEEIKGLRPLPDRSFPPVSVCFEPLRLADVASLENVAVVAEALLGWTLRMLQSYVRSPKSASGFCALLVLKRWFELFEISPTHSQLRANISPS